MYFPVVICANCWNLFLKNAQICQVDYNTIFAIIHLLCLYLGSRWRVKTLTYKISKYPKNLNRESVDIEIKKAFSIWSNHTDLDFQHKKHGQVHIEIKFELGDHKDGDPFDGPGGTLAHAYFPVYGGDAHFDDSEQWTINSFRGTNLFQVAAHEFGHSLGLSHSDIRSSLMAPFYRGYDPNFVLDTDDIHGIQALYGHKKMNHTKTAIQPQVVNSVSIDENLLLCSDSKIDTIFTSADGHTYVFKGQYFWKLSSDGINDAQPQLISTIWKGLPGNIDAAFTYKNGKTYFFKGSRYWRYIDKIKDGDYPKYIDEGFTGIPDNIDAVTVWTGNGKIYFYKGSKFWRFDPFDKPPVNKSYPKPIANWLGIPDHLDAAFSHHGYTYFFKDESYYRFNDRNFAIDIADPPFPRSTAYWWFGCRSVGKEALLNIQWKQIRNDSQSSNVNKLEHKGLVFGDDSDYTSEDNIALDELT
uniref:Peptidase metallopeptidase domain-containing protein n=1 Tax=Trichogramma kaykai TaxID=54128 RepID=A0ABD2WDK6_9HYME